VPYVIFADESKSKALPVFNIKERTAECDFNSIKPLLAQMVMLAYKKNKNPEFVKSVYPKLVKHIAHWENTQKKKGLFVWRSLRGSGSDNTLQSTADLLIPRLAQSLTALCIWSFPLWPR
jgi:hypothetical protein